MQLALILGHATATVKHDSIAGNRLAIVQPVTADGTSPDGDPVIVVDQLGSARGDTVMITSDVRNMTKMGRALDTTLFVKNGPCMASLGLGGEGYISFSIATPTGEGVTTPLTFTRERRCSLIDDLRIIGR